MPIYTFSENELKAYTKAVKQLAIIENNFQKVQLLKRKLSNAEKDFEEAKSLNRNFGMFEDCGESYRQELFLSESRLQSLQSELKTAKKILKDSRRNLNIQKETLGKVHQNVEHLLYDHTADFITDQNKHRKTISRFGGDFFLTVHSVVAHKEKRHMKPMTPDEQEILALFKELKKEANNRNLVRVARVNIPDNLDTLKKSIKIFKEGNLLFSKEQTKQLNTMLNPLEKAL